MTRITRTLIASLAVAMIGSPVLVAPASAGGSIAINYTPKTAKEKQALEAGLGIYAIVNAVKGGASIKQLGKNNFAGLGQNGSGNLGIIHQEGKGHSATLQQNGNGNSYGIFEFGKGTNANVTQNGNGKTGATFAFGW